MLIEILRQNTVLRESEWIHFHQHTFNRISEYVVH